MSAAEAEPITINCTHSDFFGGNTVYEYVIDEANNRIFPNRGPEPFSVRITPEYFSYRSRTNDASGVFAWATVTIDRVSGTFRVSPDSMPSHAFAQGPCSVVAVPSRKF